MSTSNNKNPLQEWFEAGMGLMAEQANFVTDQINKKKEESNTLINELSAKGEEVEARMRETLNPKQLWETTMSNPFFSLLPSFNRKSQREQKLEALSAKVDLLVEQVALLAAKQAAEKSSAKAKPATATSEKPAAKTTTRRTASKSTTSSGTTTRRRTTAAKKKSDDKPTE